MDSVAGLHQSVTWFLVGLIWYVQLVHYPSFAGWSRENFSHWHAFHSHRTGWIVAPTMILELGLAAITAPGSTLSLVGFGLVLLIWAVTFFVMMPLHRRLAPGYDEHLHRSLLRWNWVRTAAWTFRGALLL